MFSLKSIKSQSPPVPLSLRKDTVRWMMNSIFHCIEVELNTLIALGDKMDSFHSLYMLVKMSHHVWTAENVDPASFLSTTLGNVLVTVKRNFDKCIVSKGDALWVIPQALILDCSSPFHGPLKPCSTFVPGKCLHIPVPAD